MPNQQALADSKLGLGEYCGHWLAWTNRNSIVCWFAVDCYRKLLSCCKQTKARPRSNVYAFEGGRLPTSAYFAQRGSIFLHRGAVLAEKCSHPSEKPHPLRM